MQMAFKVFTSANFALKSKEVEPNTLSWGEGVTHYKEGARKLSSLLVGSLV